MARTGAVLLGLMVLASAAALATWFLGSGRWIALPRYFPAAAVVAIAACAVAVSVAAWRRAEQRSGTRALAHAVEQERGLRRGSLTGLLEIGGVGAVADRAAGGVAASLAGRPLAPRRYRSIRSGFAVGGAAAALAMLGFAWSGARHRDAMEVLWSPLDAAKGTLLAPMRIESAPHSLAQGATPVLRISAPARAWIDVHSRVPGATWTVARHRVRADTATVALPSIHAVTTVFATDARSASDTVAISVTPQPFVRALSMEVVYPAFLNRPTERLDAAGQLMLPEGALIRLRGTASTALSSAELTGPGVHVPLDTEGASFSGTVPVRGTGVLEWSMITTDGAAVNAPPPLSIIALHDAPPSVEIISPASDTTVSGDEPVMIAVRATDDHGLHSSVLRVRTPAAERMVALPIPSAGGTATTDLDLSAVEPGQTVRVDASAVERVGGRSSTSAARVITVMRSADARNALRAVSDSADRLAAGLAAGQREIERRTAITAASQGQRVRADEGSRATGHELASRARGIVQEQRDLAARADSLASLTRSLEARLGRAGALDQGLAARLAEVRSLLERALTAELLARLREAEQSARDGAEEPLRRSLAEVAREQRRAREQLERVVRMLRRAAVEGSLETLRAEAVELAREPLVSDAGARTGKLADDIGAVQQRLTDEGARAGARPLAAAQERSRAAGEAIGRSERDAASAALDSTAQALAHARAAQIAEWKQELAADLDAAVQELLHLAAAEETLARRVAGGAEWRGEHASLEESAAAVAERVSRAAGGSTLVSSRSDGLVRAARDQVRGVSAPSFPPRDRTQTSALMREAAMSLTRAAASLVRDRDRTNSARSASGFTELLEELQRLAREQRGINAAAAGLPLSLAGADAAAARESARVLARQQRAVARALEEIGDADGGGRAQPLAVEANRLADALERTAVDGSVIARQERLYHRLLEGGRLLTGAEGEEDERREATAAGLDRRAVIQSEGVPRNGAHRAPGWAELSRLSPAERQMIVEYFERLNGGR